MELVSLICHRDVELGIKCLGSLLSCCDAFSGLVLLEDGSLTDGDVQRLKGALPKSRIWFRSDRDPIVNQRLANYPECRRYRDSQPLGLKLFDLAVLFPSGFLFVDCDIAFFRMIDIERIRAAAAEGFVFMKDDREGYSGRAIDLVYRHKLNIYSRINSGIICFAPALYDLDFVEWFLGVPEFQVFPHLMEQTCWAAMSRNSSTWVLDKRQFRCVSKHTHLDDHTAALHFIFPFKGLVDSFLPSRIEDSDQRVLIEVRKASRLTLPRIIFNAVSNRLLRITTMLSRRVVRLR